MCPDAMTVEAVYPAPDLHCVRNQERDSFANGPAAPPAPGGATRWVRAAKRVLPLSPSCLQKVEVYIAARLARSIGLSDLAAVAGLSRMHFAARFRRATGLSPHEFLLIRRIERAKQMLKGVDASPVEVALSVGFQTQSHFSTVFKRLTGFSPAAWQRAAAVSGPPSPTNQQKKTQGFPFIC